MGKNLLSLDKTRTSIYGKVYIRIEYLKISLKIKEMTKMKKYFQPELSFVVMEIDVILASQGIEDDPTKGDIFGGNSLSQEGL